MVGPVGDGEGIGPRFVTGVLTGSMGFILVGVDTGLGLFPTVTGGRRTGLTFVGVGDG